MQFPAFRRSLVRSAPLLLALAHSALAQAPAFQWARQLGAPPLSAFTYAQSVHAHGTAAFTTGYTTATLPGQISSGADDAFVAKYDASGNLLWTRQFGGPGRDWAQAVSADPAGNSFVGGTTDNALPSFTRTGYWDAFLRKYDPAGNELWTRQFGASSFSETKILALAVNPAGEIFAAGIVTASLSGQPFSGNSDAFVRKYDTDGNVLWTRQFGTPAADAPLRFSFTPSGALLVAGHTSGAFPGQVKSGADDAFLAQFDASGNLLWITQYGSGSGSYTRIFGLGTAPDGSIFAAGHTTAALPGQVSAGQYDAYVRKLDSTGSELWTRQFGSPGFDEVRGVSVDSTGNVFAIGIAGQALPGQTSPGGQDVFVRKYSSSGVESGTTQFGTPDADNVLSGSGDSTGALYAAGYSNGIFPGQSKSGYFDGFLVRFQGNAIPALTTVQSQLSVPEGSTAANSGTFADADLGDNVTLTASLGTITKAGTSNGSWAWSWFAADGPAAPQTVAITANDGKGGVAVLTFTVAVSNVTPGVTFSVTPALNENQTATLIGAITDPGSLDSHAVAISWGDGSTSTITLPAGTLAFTAAHTYPDDNPTATASDSYSVSVAVSDKDGDGSSAVSTLTVNNAAPILGAATGPLDPLALGAAATLSVPVSDAGPNDTLTCLFSWNDGSPDTLVSPASGSCSASHTYGAAGVYAVTITASDDDTGTATVRFEYVVVYDPAAGFVTGGGWILSPAGAYALNPSATGKAHFGFVSKYLPGAQTPSGQTEFQFQTAAFHFTSTSYQWLVVAGARAQYKGSGSVNGAGGYGFLLTATDGQINGGGGTDRFRIKIWNESTGVIVYDNVAGASDSLENASPQALGGGSITIHTR